MDSFPSINNHSDNNNIRSIKPESKYERLRRIGIGSYGVVFKCVNRQSGQIVAIKRYSENDSDPIIRRIAMREVKMLRHLKHPNLINLIEVFRRKRRLHLVFDYCELTVLDVIEKYANNCPLNLIKKIIWQTVNGINYCHTHNCIHRDIKPENILINQSGIVKLCDFGFARNIGKSLGEEKNFNFSKQPGALIHAAKSYARNDNNNNHGLNSETNPKESQYNIQERQALTEYVATRWYRAPELLIGDIFYDIKIDIWAIGCVTAELMKGEPMWPGKTDADQLCLIKSSLGQLTPSQQNTLLNQSIYDQNTIEKILTQPASLGEALNRKLPVLKIGHSGLDFVSSCLRMDPLKRPDSGELLKHPYIFSSRMSQFMVQNNFSSHHRKRTSLAEPRRFSLINSQSLTMLASNKASPIKRDPIQAKPVVFNSKTKSQIPTKDTSKKVTTTSDNFSSISIKAPAKPTANDSKTAAHKGEDKENFKQKSSINKPMLNFDNSELNSGQKNKRADETKLIGMKKINPLGENKISNQYHLRDGTKCDSNRQAINGNVLQVNAKQTAAAAKKRADSSATSTSTTDTPENPSANRLKSSYQSISFLPSVVPQLQRRNNSALPMRRGAN